MKLKWIKFFLIGLMLCFLSPSFAHAADQNSQNSSIDTSRSSFEYFQNEGAIDKDAQYELWANTLNNSPKFTDLNTKAANSDDLIQPFSMTGGSGGGGYSLKKGDILISNRTSSSGLTGHAGIAIGTVHILSIPGYNSRTQLYTLSQWAKSYGNTTKVYREADSSVAADAAHWAYQHLYVDKRPYYNLSPSWTSTATEYCSKIVYQGYYYGTGDKNVVLSAVSVGAYILPYALPNYFIYKKYPLHYLTSF